MTDKDKIFVQIEATQDSIISLLKMKKAALETIIEIDEKVEALEEIRRELDKRKDDIEQEIQHRSPFDESSMAYQED